jgi:hypothetical protein
MLKQTLAPSVVRGTVEVGVPCVVWFHKHCCCLLADHPAPAPATAASGLLVTGVDVAIADVLQAAGVRQGQQE